MDISWFNALPDDVRQLLIGAGGDFIGGLAGQVTAGLLGSVSGRIRRKLEGTQREQALAYATARALAQTVQSMTQDRDEAKRWLQILQDWLEQQPVLDELARLIEPQPGVELNLKLLRKEFDANGRFGIFLYKDAEFTAMVETLAAAFYNAAAQQEELQGVIEIQLLRSMVDQLAVIAQAQQGQQEKLADILQILQRFEPLSLEPLERRYLKGLYDECNDLRVIRDPREQPGGRSRPRLQRVWVQLQTGTSPSLEQVLTRLKLPAQKQREAERLCRTAAQRGTAERSGGDLRSARGKGEPGEQSDTVSALKQLPEEELTALAKQLGVAVEHLAAALENLTPVEALHAMRQIVVVGAPGSGKSMLTQRLAALLAAAGSGDPDLLSDLSDHERDDLQDLLTKLGRRLLPVRIVLSRWTPASGREPCADDLIDECVRVVGSSGDLGALKGHLMSRLKPGAATLLVLLDGLDEVTDRTRRERQLAALEDFHRHYRDVPLIVTCRVLPYQAWRRQGDILSLPDAQLDCLTDAAIAQFIDRWYDELKRTGVYEDHALAEQSRQRLRTAVSDTQRANYEELHKMAGFPLLLTMMAHVNYRKALPESRAALYNDFVEQLLYKWEEYRLGAGESTRLNQLLDEANADMEDFKRILRQLAYDLTSQARRRDLVDIDGLALEGRLRSLPRRRLEDDARAAWAANVRRFITDRSGLLNAEDENTYRFSHLSFQEYMAAAHLITGSSDQKLAHFRQWIDQEHWREIIQLGIGILVNVISPAQWGDALYLMSGLLPPDHEPFSDQASARLLLLGDIYLRLLGAESLRSCNNQDVARDTMVKVATALTRLMQSQAQPSDRLVAGLLLADLADSVERLGDPNFDPAMLHLEPAGLDDFIPIPGLPGVRIGKYLVTNAQFRRFYDANGYQTRAWWSDKGWEYKQRLSWTEPRYWGNEQFNRRTQPVNVSWHEAEAYCNWLSATRTHGAIGVDECVRLPSEEQWLRAARNGRPAPADAKVDFPWRGRFEPWRANTEENKGNDLAQTSPVHMYAGGCTPGGVWDMLGNVWEWTATLDRIDKNGDPWYIVRGGSYWQSSADRLAGLRSAVDSGNLWGYPGGFRAVVVPILSCAPSGC